MKYTFEFSIEEIRLIAGALEAVPLGQAFTTYLSLKAQLDAQNKEKQENKDNKLGGD